MNICLKDAKIAIRVDGNQYIGLGHIFRCIYLAEYITKYGGTPYFVMLNSSINLFVKNLIIKKKFSYYIISHSNDPWREDVNLLKKIIHKELFRAIIIDLLVPDKSDSDLNFESLYLPSDLANLINELSFFKIPIFVFSDQFDKISVACDLIINTCPSQDYNWYNYSEKYLLGPKYYIVGKSFLSLINIQKTFRSKKKKVVIFCGGNDHRNFTNLILETITNLISEFEIEVIVGASTPNTTSYNDKIKNDMVKYHYQPMDVAQILFDADAAISTSGNTLFDLAAIGIPSAALSTRERQRITARFFHKKGACIDIGSTKKEIITGIDIFFNMLLNNKEKLYLMHRCGKQIVDGNGAFRIIKEMSLRL